MIEEGVVGAVEMRDDEMEQEGHHGADHHLARVDHHVRRIEQTLDRFCKGEGWFAWKDEVNNGYCLSSDLTTPVANLTRFFRWIRASDYSAAGLSAERMPRCYFAFHDRTAVVLGR